MSLDGQGRLYIAEHHRNRHGTQDTREHPLWLDEDRASRSVEERLAFMQRHAGKGAPPMSFYTELPDRFVRGSDADGSVWLTGIPHVWRLPAFRFRETPLSHGVVSGSLRRCEP